MSWFLRRPAPAVPGVDERTVDGLRHPDPDVRAASVRSCGVARMEAAVPLLADRLLDSQPGVRAAAARALGRIGGARCADALLRAARTRRIPAGRLARELARCAPDLYLEAALEQPENREVRAVLALAAVLRGRSSTVWPMLFALRGGTEAERAVAYHALGAAGGQDAVPMLIDALFDHSPRVQQSVRSSLQRLGALAPSPHIKHERPVPPPTGFRRLIPGARTSRRPR